MKIEKIHLKNLFCMKTETKTFKKKLKKMCLHAAIYYGSYWHIIRIKCSKCVKIVSVSCFTLFPFLCMSYKTSKACVYKIPFIFAKFKITCTVYYCSCIFGFILPNCHDTSIIVAVVLYPATHQLMKKVWSLGDPLY